MSSSPEAILAIVREVISMMPANSENMVLRLNPEDAVIVKQAFEIESATELRWKLFEDPSIQAGGCILCSDNSEINADLEQRIETVVTKLLGASKDDE